MLIYNKEISSEILATLSYIYITVGGKIQKGNQFNNILYKLYDYLKDDFIFDEGITITKSLIDKINQFKNIANTLPDPDIEGGWKLQEPQITTNNCDDFQYETEYKDIQSGEYLLDNYKIMLKPGEKVYFRVNLEFSRRTDGHNVKATGDSASTAIPSDAVYAKLQLTMGAYFSMKALFYNQNDEVIGSTASKDVGTSYKPSEYNFRVKYFFVRNKSYEVYINTTYDFTIEEDNLKGIDASILTIDDKYYAEKINEVDEITLSCLINKKINGKLQDQKYEILKSRLGTKVVNNTGLPLRFITITKNEEDTLYYAFISDYPFYMLGYNPSVNADVIGHMVANTSLKTYFELWQSTDGNMWEKNNESMPQMSTENPYKYTKGQTYIENQKIYYSNYNIYASYITSDSINPIEGFDVSNTTGIHHLVKETDEELTIGNVGVGAVIKFGNHVVEDSGLNPILFQTLDYTENLNIIGEGISGYAKRPENAMFLDTLYYIDCMYMLPTAITKLDSYQNNNTTLHRFLNATGSKGKWWTAIGEEDIPPTAENNTSSTAKNGHYDHRAGFLNYFTTAERNALISTTLENGYKGKVFLRQHEEAGTVSSSKISARPMYYRYSNSIRTAKVYADFVLNHHLNKDNLPVDSLIRAWGRTKDTSNGYYYGGSTSSYFGNRAEAICPSIFLSLDTKLIKNDDNTYSVVLDDNEEIILSVMDIDIKKESIREEETVSDTKKNIEAYKSINVDTERSVIFKIFKEIVLDTIRKIKKYTIGIYDNNKSIEKSIKALEDTAKNVEVDSKSLIDTERTISRIFKEAITLDVIRNLCKNTNIIADNERNTSVFASSIGDTERNTAIDIENLLDNNRNIAVNHEDIADDIRNVVKNAVVDNDIRRNVLADILNLLDVERNTEVKSIDSIDTVRIPGIGIASLLDNNRNVTVDVVGIADIRKEAIKTIVDISDLERSVIVSFIEKIDTIKSTILKAEAVLDTEKEAVKKIVEAFDTMRDTLKEIDVVLSVDTARNIAIIDHIEADTKADINKGTISLLDTKKTVEATIDTLYDVNRSIKKELVAAYDVLEKILVEKIDSFDISDERIQEVISIFDTLRQVNTISTIEKFFDTSRKITNMDRNNTVLLEKVSKDKNSSGLSVYNYIPVKKLKCNIYDVKNTVEPLPSLVTEKTRYIVITRDKTVKADNVINYRNKRYIIEAITRNRVFTEIYLKED